MAHGPLYAGVREQASRDRCLITQGRVRIRADGQGRSDMLALGPATWVAD